MDNMKVFIDMDGVLADYFTAVETMMGVEHYSQADFNQVVDRIRILDMEVCCNPSLINSNKLFFGKLKPLPGKNELLDAVIRFFGEYSIITTPLKGHEHWSMVGKMLWIGEHLWGGPADIIFTHDKAQLAAPGNILIDDYRPNIERWEAAGGIGIKYKALSKNYSLDDIIKQLLQIKKQIRDAVVEHKSKRPPRPFIDPSTRKI